MRHVEVSHSCSLIHTAIVAAAAATCVSVSETWKMNAETKTGWHIIAPPMWHLNIQTVFLVVFTQPVRTATTFLKFHQGSEVIKGFGSVEATIVPLTAVLSFNLLPFSRGKRSVKKPLTWLQRVNPCVHQNELEYFKHVHTHMHMARTDFICSWCRNTWALISLIIQYIFKEVQKDKREKMEKNPDFWYFVMKRI